MDPRTIQRQYDEVIADRYDLDPQSVLGDSLARALAQIEAAGLLGAGHGPLAALDVGMGTGRFLEMLEAASARPLAPHGLDLSARMIELARRRLPDLEAVVDDAARLDRHFEGRAFDLVSTHFVTGYVPIEAVAGPILERLAPGGRWSFVGGTRGGFPELERKADRPLLRRAFGAQHVSIGDLVTNPDDEADVARRLEAHGFEVERSETFEPKVSFPNFEAFMEFGHRGGWLTPIIEAIGLHRAGRIPRALLDAFFFPVEDRHRIVIALARKPG